MKQVTCNACGWVHFGLTRAEVEREVTRFNVWFDAASHAVQANYGGKRSSEKHYLNCFRCGNPYVKFHTTVAGEAPRGSTIQPIMLSLALE
ncbi:MAG: hypothetical protein Q7J84_10485 [Sulfuricaulis sp.]|nr:hypothetical protein [Sulfuricaulis sp.]